MRNDHTLAETLLMQRFAAAYFTEHELVFRRLVHAFVANGTVIFLSGYLAIVVLCRSIRSLERS